MNPWERVTPLGCFLIILAVILFYLAFFAFVTLYPDPSEFFTK